MLRRDRREAGDPPASASRRLRRRPRVRVRRLARVLSVLGFVGFNAFLIIRLREGFERRAADPAEATEGVPEEPEEVVSRAIEFTRLDERGRPLFELTAEEALGRSDGRQRFLGVEVRVVAVYDDRDTLVAADELLVEPRTESLEFLGNVLLEVEGLELSGPRLQFRRAPDRLWSDDPVQFLSEDFVGIAASMRFRIGSGGVILRGVVAEPVAEGGFSVVADRVSFDRESGDTTLFGDIEIASEGIELASAESVVARRDRERRRLHTMEAGFGTVLRVLPEAQEAEPADAEPAAVTLRADEVEIELGGGRTPRIVHARDNPVVSEPSGAELRGGRGRLDLDTEGRPERLWLSGEVRSRLELGGEPGSRVSIEAGEAEFGFDGDGNLAAARYRGGVEARYGRASASADGADWDGEDTLVLRGAPRVVDSSLLELESTDLRLIVGEASRIEAEGTVTARFLPERLEWLPGQFDEAGLTSETATLESGAGRGAFSGGVRLLFGRNRLLADTLDVDAEIRTLHAAGAVATSLEFEPPQDEAEPESPKKKVAFDANSERFVYDADASQLVYGGAPRLEQRASTGDATHVRGGRIEATLLPDGSLSAVTSAQGARFERGPNQVSAGRIRYEPDADRLEAWGSPAVVEIEGRLSEGGHLELAFGEDRSEIHPTRTRRALARVRIEERPPGG